MAQGRGRDTSVPIPGTTRAGDFDENMAALEVRVSEEDDRQIREAIAKTEAAGTRYAEGNMAFCYVTNEASVKMAPDPIYIHGGFSR